MFNKKKKITVEGARLKLADLCARSEQCEYDLKTKLVRWGLAREEIDEIMGFLRDGKFVDNSRYARAFARDKARFSRWGRRKIAVGLAAKRIPSDVVRDALEAIDEEEYLDALDALTVAKMRSINMADPKDRQKLYSYLISRGYESSLVVKAIKKAQVTED